MSKAKERLDPNSGDVDKIEASLHLLRYEYAFKEVNGAVLDVGCGLGYGSALLYRSHNSIVPFDISLPALSYAKKIYPGPQYLRADAQSFPFVNEHFDSVVALEIIEHLDNGFLLLREIHRVLKENGLLIVSTPNTHHFRNRLDQLVIRKRIPKIPVNPYHKHEYSPEEFEKLLESAGFTIEQKKGQLLTFPFVAKLPPRLCVNTGLFLPNYSLHIIYNARKTHSQN